MVPPHIRKVEDELLCVVEGRLEATVGDQTHALAAGDLVKMPRGLPRALRTSDSGPTRTLWLVVPAGQMEGLFRALGALPPDRPPDIEQLMRIFRDHDIEPLPPPAG
jgi:hypothetical protein